MSPVTPEATRPTAATWTNWSGLETARPSRDAAPASTEEVVAEVRRALDGRSGDRPGGRVGPVKMVGTGHSFTGVASPEGGTLLHPSRLSGVVAVDRGAMTVTVRAGTRLDELNLALESHGLALHNLGDIAEQTVAGAISTGTHGTGGRAASLAAQVVGLELVTGTGEVLRCSAAEHPDVLDLARLGLGALGVLTEVTLAVEPLFLLEAVEQPMGWDEALSSFDTLTAAADHVDAYWFPHTDRLLVKQNTRRGTDLSLARPLPRLRGWFDDDFLQNTAFGVLTAGANRSPRVIPALNRTSARLLSARRYCDVAHRVFTAKRRVVFREMEYAVPRAAGLDVLRECRRVLDASDLRVSFPVELRVAPADDVPLSTAYRRDSFYLAFHVHRAAEHRDYFALMEPVLRAHDGRPHWGKLHTRTAADLAPAYPRFDDFLALRDRLDPERVFANDYLRSVLGD